MGLRIKKDTIRRQRRGNIREAKMNIHTLVRGQRIGKLVFMKIDQCPGTGLRFEGLKIRQAHEVGRDESIITSE